MSAMSFGSQAALGYRMHRSRVLPGRQDLVKSTTKPGQSGLRKFEDSSSILSDAQCIILSKWPLKKVSETLRQLVFAVFQYRLQSSRHLF
jgi:hypothetical protein